LSQTRSPIRKCPRFYPSLPLPSGIQKKSRLTWPSLSRLSLRMSRDKHSFMQAQRLFLCLRKRTNLLFLFFLGW
jgi:hypothetical protein